MITCDSLMLTPHSLRYIFNLRPGSTIWTYNHDSFITAPLEFEIGERLDEYQIIVSIDRYTIWAGSEAPVLSGYHRDTYNVVDTEVLTIDGYQSIGSAEGAYVPRVPVLDLMSAEYLGSELPLAESDALKRLHKNLSKQSKEPFLELSYPALGRFDNYVQYGSVRQIESVTKTGRKIPSVKVKAPNIVAYQSLIVKGA